MTKLLSLSSNPRRLVLFGLAAGAAQVAGCGGGGGGLAGIGSGGTGSFTTGVITGLGSIIVNGVRYTDDTAEKIAADDSTARALIPGMVGPLRVRRSPPPPLVAFPRRRLTGLCTAANGKVRSRRSTP